LEEVVVVVVVAVIVVVMVVIVVAVVAVKATLGSQRRRACRAQGPRTTEAGEETGSAGHKRARL
jgi:NADH:ubiquinone oxidoreductase subunit 3 (subunit A)